MKRSPARWTWKNRAGLRDRGESRETMIQAAAIAALVLIAILALFFVMRREPQAPPEAPAAREIAFRALPENAPEAEVARKAPAMEVESSAAPPSDASKEAAQPKAEEAPGGSVSGTVRVAGTSEPAPGVLVVVRKEMPSEDRNFVSRFQALKLEEGDRSAASAADGRYRIGGIPQGEHRVFALRGETDFVDIPPAGGKRLTVGADLAAQTIDIEVNFGGTIFGKVLDGDEKPIALAKVSAPPRDFLSAAFEAESDFRMDQTITKEDGSYRISGLPIEKSYVVLAEAKDKAKVLTEEIAFTSEEREVEMDLILLPGSIVSGRVVGPGGEPVEGVDTQMHTEATSLFLLEPRSSRTDVSGAFKFEHLPAGSYLLKAGEASGKEVSRTIECDGESEVSGLVLTLASASPEGDSLSGRVVDDTGTGVPGVAIQLAGFVPSKGPFVQSTTSEADGSFSFKGVSPGMLNLTANHEKYAPVMKAGVAPGPSPIEVVLERVARVRGTVTSRSGDPVAGALIKVSPVSKDAADFSKFVVGQIPGGLPSVKSGPDGAFALEKVVPGRARIRAEASGFAPGFSEEIEIAPNQDIADLKLELSEGGALAGVVVSPDGKPVMDARVTAVEVSTNALENQMKRIMPTLLGGGSAPVARTEDDGTFKLSHLPQGKFLLSATHGDFSPCAEMEVALKPDEKRDGIKLGLRKLSTIRVQVREKAKPLPDLMIQVLGAAPMRMSTSDQDGKAEFAGLPPGDYIVQVMDMAKMMAGQGMGLRQKTAQLSEGQSMDVEFAFGAGAKVSGKVSGKLPGAMSMIVISRPGLPKAEEMDPSDFQAIIRASQFNVGMAFIAADGTYSIPDVPDGDFILEVPRVPADFAKAAQMTPKERESLYRKPLKVEGGRDVQVPDIRIGEDRIDAGAAEPKPQPPREPPKPQPPREPTRIAPPEKTEGE